MELPMETANRAVLDALSDQLLHPAVVRAALARAIEYLQPSEGNAEAEIDRLAHEAKALEGERERLTEICDVPRSRLTAVLSLDELGAIV